MGKYIEKGTMKIYIEEYMPENVDKQTPLVIFSHGFNGSANDFQRECTILKEKGIGSVCFDFCGGSLQSRSSGKTEEMSLLTEKDNLIAVLEYVQNIEMVDKDRIFLFGGSQGGMVSALVAEEMADAVAGLLLLYPALCIPDDWMGRYPNVSDMPDKVELWGVTLGRIYRETVQDWVIWEKIGKYNKPVMIMHGDKDEIVPIEYARKAANLYPKAYYEEFAGEGHGFTPEGMDRVVAMVKAFVKAEKVLDIQVKLEGNEEIISEQEKIHFLPFSGTAKGEWFEGEILPGGVDTQMEDEKGTKLSARYVLQGKDKAGKDCCVFVQNEGMAAKYGLTVTKAKIVTDSESLRVWNQFGLRGIVLPVKEKAGEVIIRFYEL